MVENEDIHLKELMVKLESTRNVEDYSHDNHLAMIFSKSLITKSTLECNPSKYLLAMLLEQTILSLNQKSHQIITLCKLNLEI